MIKDAEKERERERKEEKEGESVVPYFPSLPWDHVSFHKYFKNKLFPLVILFTFFSFFLLSLSLCLSLPHPSLSSLVITSLANFEMMHWKDVWQTWLNGCKFSPRRRMENVRERCGRRERDDDGEKEDADGEKEDEREESEWFRMTHLSSSSHYNSSFLSSIPFLWNLHLNLSSSLWSVFDSIPKEGNDERNTLQ